MSYHLMVEYSGNPIFKENFINAWNRLITHYKSLGYILRAELIQSDSRTLVGHSIWKDKEAFKESLALLSQKSSTLNSQLESHCDSIQLKYAGKQVKKL